MTFDKSDAVSTATADPAETAAAEAQLGRPVRGRVSIAHRCQCGLPDVLATEPRLPDGSPFPTHFYLTCPRANAAVSTLESEGLMGQFATRLADDPEFAEAYARAHEDFLARRAAWGEVAEIEGISAGGMPDRVKCLHALLAHALAAGPSVNPVGDEVLAILNERGMWSRTTACVDVPPNQEPQ